MPCQPCQASRPLRAYRNTHPLIGKSRRLLAMVGVRCAKCHAPDALSLQAWPDISRNWRVSGTMQLASSASKLWRKGSRPTACAGRTVPRLPMTCPRTPDFFPLTARGTNRSALPARLDGIGRCTNIGIGITDGGRSHTLRHSGKILCEKKKRASSAKNNLGIKVYRLTFARDVADLVKKYEWR